MTVSAPEASKPSRGFKLDLKTAGPLIALILLVILGYSLNPLFLGEGNVTNILTRSAFIGIIAVGATFVITAGGIDVGTKQQIYHIIAALAAEGKSVIVISSEMQEVIGLSHRVLVMRNGRLAGQLEGAEIVEAEIMRYAAGIKQDGDNDRISA